MPFGQASRECGRNSPLSGLHELDICRNRLGFQSGDCVDEKFGHGEGDSAIGKSKIGKKRFLVFRRDHFHLAYLHPRWKNEGYLSSRNGLGPFIGRATARIWFAVGSLGEFVSIIVDKVQIDFISLGRTVGAYAQGRGRVKAAEPDS